MFWRNSLLVMTGVFSLWQTGWTMGGRAPIVDTALNGSAHMTESLQYVQALKALLGKNWALSDGPIHIWTIPDPKVPATADHRELQEKLVTDPATLDPKEVGIWPGNPDGDLYAGPFIAQLQNKPYVFALSYDNRPWGYDATRCFIFYRALDSIQDKNQKTNLAEVSCKDAERIRNLATFPMAQGFEPLNNDGKKLLTSLSNQNWAKTIQMPIPRYPDRTVTYREKFRFSFWNDFSKFQYTSRVEVGAGDATTSPIEDIAQLGMRSAGPGITEFLIWGHRTHFISQSANKMNFMHIKTDLWSIKAWDEIEPLYDANPNYYCYDGFDCSGAFNKNQLWTSIYQELAAEYIVMSYDKAKPNELTVRYEEIDPRFPSLTTTYQSQ